MKLVYFTKSQCVLPCFRHFSNEALLDSREERTEKTLSGLEQASDFLLAASSNTLLASRFQVGAPCPFKGTLAFMDTDMKRRPASVNAADPSVTDKPENAWKMLTSSLLCDTCSFLIG